MSAPGVSSVASTSHSPVACVPRQRVKSQRLIGLGSIHLVCSLAVCGYSIFVAETVNEAEYASIALVCGILQAMASFFAIYGAGDIGFRQFSIITAMMLASVGSIAAIVSVANTSTNMTEREGLCNSCKQTKSAACSQCSSISLGTSHVGLLVLTATSGLVGFILVICTYFYTCCRIPLRSSNVSPSIMDSLQDKECTNSFEISLNSGYM